MARAQGSGPVGENDPASVVPGARVAIPSERVLDQAGNEAHVLQPATARADGTARIIVDADLTGATALRSGVPGTGVFLIEGWPEPGAALGDATYSIRLIEVFEDEYDGGFSEVDPWS